MSVMRGVFVLATMLALSATAAPVERVDSLVTALKAFDPDAGGAAREKAMAGLDAHFDLDAFSTAALGPSREKLSAAQVREFKERLSALVRQKGYPAGAGFFREGEARQGKPRTTGDRTTVPFDVYFPAEDLAMSVGFVVGADGRVVDIVVDGEPMTADYRSQVARVLSKSSPEELLQRLAEKQKEAAGAGR